MNSTQGVTEFDLGYPYQVSDFDAVSFVLAICAIALVGSMAAFLPARRAAKVDLMVALRYE